MTPTANQNKIIELLNLYYDGKTTIEQEQTLIKYLSPSWRWNLHCSDRLFEGLTDLNIAKE